MIIDGWKIMFDFGLIMLIVDVCIIMDDIVEVLCDCVDL